MLTVAQYSWQFWFRRLSTVFCIARSPWKVAAAYRAFFPSDLIKQKNSGRMMRPQEVFKGLITNHRISFLERNLLYRIDNFFLINFCFIYEEYLPPCSAAKTTEGAYFVFIKIYILWFGYLSRKSGAISPKHTPKLFNTSTGLSRFWRKNCERYNSGDVVGKFKKIFAYQNFFDLTSFDILLFCLLYSIFI